MAVTITPITLNDLTLATLDGTGVFDVLMRANKAHLEAEYSKNRIKGSEYATVYLGSLEAVLNAALQFLLQKDKIALEAQLIEQQILLAQVEVIKANAQVLQTEAQTELVKQQTANALAELAILQANALKIPAEIAHLQAQTAMVGQQTENLDAELLNIPKQGIVLDKQALDIVAKTTMTTQQTTNLVAEALNIPKQGAVLDGQKCKLDAEFDLLKTTNLKTAEEQALLAWKTTTEKAQTTALGVDDNSVIGKQKALYTAQTSGFTRDAEQKAADIMVKTWMARRTTDEGTVADSANMLNDVAVGRAVNKLLSGVGA